LPFLSELSQKTSEFFQKTWELSQKNVGAFSKKRWTFSKKRGRFSEKRWTFSKKRGSFFSSPSERIFLTANRNTNKAGNGRAASLEVQPLIARIDNFQAWTHNYNITRAKKVIKMWGWKGDNRSQKK